MDSILDSIKKMLGIPQGDTSFDTDVIFHINSAISVISQITSDIPEGYRITSRSNTWSELLGEKTDIELIKELIFLKVKLMFDPPASSYAMSAMKDREDKLEWYASTKGGDRNGS